uniref:hypothetical protein n=1 Tax=Salmonella enterica TaxID=28901 RepID=UPI00398C4BC2
AGRGRTRAQMAVDGHCGVQVGSAALAEDQLAGLYNEGVSGVSQVRREDRVAVEALLAQYRLADCVQYHGQALAVDRSVIAANDQQEFTERRHTLHFWWAHTTSKMQRQRDNPHSAHRNRYDQPQ